MASNAARKPRPKADPVDPTEHARAGRRDKNVQGLEATAAPRAADAEAGGHPTAEVQQGRVDQPFVVDTNGEVRAGPGDAGAQDAPRVLDNPQDTPPKSNAALLGGLAAGVLLMVVIIFIAA